MPRGPRGEKRPADVIGNAVHVMQARPLQEGCRRLDWESIMAMARCKLHLPENESAPHPYTAFARPIGYPETAVICGRRDCHSPAYLWLTRSEQVQHKAGLRVFMLRGDTAKVRVSGALTKRTNRA